MNNPADISDLELHAFIDGALDDARAREVAARLALDSSLADKEAAFRRDKAMLAKVYGAIADEPLPQKWLDQIADSKPHVRHPWRQIAAAAAVLLIVIGGGALVWKMRTPVPQDVVEAALEARAGQTPGEESVAVAQGADAGRYSEALSHTLAIKLKVPDLQKMGYRLTGLIIYRSDGAVEITYRDAGGRKVSLYVHRSDGRAHFDQFEKAGLRVCIWQDEEVSTVIAGDVSTAAMQRLASLAYNGLRS